MHLYGAYVGLRRNVFFEHDRAHAARMRKKNIKMLIFGFPDHFERGFWVWVREFSPAWNFFKKPRPSTFEYQGFSLSMQRVRV